MQQVLVDLTDALVTDFDVIELLTSVADAGAAPMVSDRLVEAVSAPTVDGLTVSASDRVVDLCRPPAHVHRPRSHLDPGVDGRATA